MSHAAGARSSVGRSPPAELVRSQPRGYQDSGPDQGHPLAALSLDLEGYENDRPEAPFRHDQGIEVQQGTGSSRTGRCTAAGAAAAETAAATAATTARAQHGIASSMSAPRAKAV